MRLGSQPQNPGFSFPQYFESPGPVSLISRAAEEESGCAHSYVQHPFGEDLNFSSCLWLGVLCWAQLLSRVWCFVTLWTAAHQALLSMGFSRQEYWRGLPFPRPEDRPDPGIGPCLLHPALSGRFPTTDPPGKPLVRGGECFTYFLTLAPISPFQPKSCIFFSSFF